MITREQKSACNYTVSRDLKMLQTKWRHLSSEGPQARKVISSKLEFNPLHAMSLLHRLNTLVLELPELNRLSSCKSLNTAFLSTDGITVFRGKNQAFRLCTCVVV
jgi:hypothetical protein